MLHSLSSGSRGHDLHMARSVGCLGVGPEPLETRWGRAGAPRRVPKRMYTYQTMHLGWYSCCPCPLSKSWSTRICQDSRSAKASATTSGIAACGTSLAITRISDRDIYGDLCDPKGTYLPTPGGNHDNPVNQNIVVTGGKEINRDS